MEQNKKKVGLCFGSFNPPHLGHVKTASFARDAYKLQEVWMMPVPVSAFKRGIPQPDFSRKIDMCEIIARPQQDWLKVTKLCQPFPPNPVLQLQAFKRLFEKLENVRPDTHFSVVAGPDFKYRLQVAVTMMNMANILASVVQAGKLSDIPLILRVAERISRSHDVLSNIQVLTPPTRSVLEGSDKPVSSAKIRQAIREGKDDIPGVPPELIGYIRRNNVYPATP